MPETSLAEAAFWHGTIHQVEAGDPVMGGPPDRATRVGGPNIAAKGLADRTQWLRAQVEDALVRLTPGQILVALRAVDGPGSGLDADTLDGLEAAAFVRSTRRIAAGDGLAGGGDLAADRTLRLAIEGLADLAAGAVADADLIAVHDASANAARRVSVADLAAALATRLSAWAPTATFADVSASRSPGVIYRNETGATIVVYVSLNDGAQAQLSRTATSTVMEVVELGDADQDSSTLTLIVPDGFRYRVSGFRFWKEMR